jgi:hypothetical protein
MAAAVAAFSELTWPYIGMTTVASACSTHGSVTPVLSAPMTSASAPVRSTSASVDRPRGVVTTTRTPRSRSQGSTAEVGAEATGTANTVPLLARTTLGLPKSVTGAALTSAATPAASAVRSIAPRLPGFSIASATRTSGSGPRSRSASAAPGVGTTATHPSGDSR